LCILTFLTPGSAPDLDALNNGALTNPHGHGYAVLTGTTTITVGHGLDGAAVIAEFAAVRERFPEETFGFKIRTIRGLGYRLEVGER